MEGAPQKVGGYFVCGNNQLTSLEGAPKTVGGNFVCSSNLLDTLKGAPETVGKIFDCFNNCLISLIDMPKMQDSAEIRCDADMARKYGLSEDKTAEDAKFTVKELYESQAYQNEVKIDVLRQVSRLREKTMQENAPKIAKTQAAFDAWLKQNGAGKNTPEK